MKVKRVKRAAKILNFFKYSFKIAPPFRVLIDGTFCMAALRDKINLREQMPKYLGEETMICTTKCVLRELELLGGPVYGATAICRQFELAECPHNQAKPASECFAELARKMKDRPKKYIFATQDDKLRDKLRSYPGVPHLYIQYNAILLDRISEDAASVDKDEIGRLRELKEKEFGVQPAIVKKKSKQKNANSLSCKKKKAPVQQLPAVAKDVGIEERKKRTRRRKKVAAATEEA
ncbi:unnamed protein product, partial [Mesorhabditis spiculigera]